MEGTRANAASRNSPGCSRVCMRARVRAKCTRASGRLRDTPLLRAAGFWQRRRRFRGRSGGDERKAVGGTDEEAEGGFFAAAPATRPRQGHVRPDWLRFLMEADLERRPPLPDDAARGRRGAQSPRPRAAGGSRTSATGGVLKGQFAHITKPALCCFFCAKRCLGDLPKWLKIIYRHLKLCCDSSGQHAAALARTRSFI